MSSISSQEFVDGSSVTSRISVDVENKEVRKQIKQATTSKELKRIVKEYREILNRIPTHRLNNWIRVSGFEFARVYNTVILRVKRHQLSQKTIKRLCSGIISLLDTLDQRFQFIPDDLKAKAQTLKDDVAIIELITTELTQ